MDDNLFDLDDFNNMSNQPSADLTTNEKDISNTTSEEYSNEEVEVFDEVEDQISDNKIENKEAETELKQDIKKIKKYAIQDCISVSEYDKITTPCIKYPFILDDFQKRGIIRVERHQNVLVCAHTSSGKTVVAEYAIAKSKKQGNKIIYTSPIKALSNQKYREFKQKFKDTGIVTGDVSINPEAQCVIMTTEILQNMLYKQSEKLKKVDYIIFDEVHYINDNERGHVWEEILILLPKNVGLVMLSATIPNYIQFAQWIGSIKESTVYVEITYKRVVPLEHIAYINTKKQFLLKTAESDVNLSNINAALDCCKEENDKIYKSKYKSQGKKERQERLDKLLNQIKSYNKFLLKKQQEKFNEILQEKGNERITTTHLKVEEIANFFIKQNLTPVVMFGFSIRNIDEYAKMLSKTQFVENTESHKIISFFNKCISKLSEEDKKIGQIQALRQLLPSGVGIHHSGLLPILKEIIEILYSKGLIKILFATTSFSIGLNMPTRTVCFLDIQKYNDGRKDIISSSEYLQMCGRAGRRGIDDKGNIYILLGDKRNPPLCTEFTNMIRGTGTSVESKFRIQYKTILSMYYRNVKNINDFFKESFIESNKFITMPKIVENIQKLKKDIKAFKSIDCKEKGGQSNIEDYYSNIYKLKTEKKKLFTLCNISALFNNPGRVISIYNKELNKVIYICVVRHYTEYNGEIWCLSVSMDTKVVIQYENKNELDKGILNKKYYSYNIIKEEDIIDIYDYTIKGCKKVLTEQDDQGYDYYKKKDLEKILSELLDINNNPNKVKVVDYLKITKNDIQVHQILQNINKYTTLVNTSPCCSCPLLDQHLKEYEPMKKKQNLLEKYKKQISTENMKFFNEFKSREKVLIELKYINNENQIELKGKAAKEITSCDCVIVTEALLSNIFDKLSSMETIAFLSCFISNSNEISFEVPEINQNFYDAVEQLKNIYNNIKEVENKYNFEESKLNRKINFENSLTIYKWMNGSHFYEILEYTDFNEGKVYSLINRLVLFLDSICEFFKILGNENLGNKFTSTKSILLREIMTCQSLYLDESLDFNNI